MRDFVADIDWSRWSETLWTSGVRVLAIVVIIFIALRILERFLEPAIRITITRPLRNAPQIEV